MVGFVLSVKQVHHSNINYLFEPMYQEQEVNHSKMASSLWHNNGRSCFAKALAFGCLWFCVCSYSRTIIRRLLNDVVIKCTCLWYTYAKHFYARESLINALTVYIYIIWSNQYADEHVWVSRTIVWVYIKMDYTCIYNVYKYHLRYTHICTVTLEVVVM